MCILQLISIILSFLSDAKVIHLMKGINNIFKPKGRLSSKQLKAEEIFHIIEVNTGVENVFVRVSTSLFVFNFSTNLNNMSSLFRVTKAQVIGRKSDPHAHQDL